MMTVFIFLSPQFIINHPEARDRDVFIKCPHHATLCVVALDEAHIHVQHGRLCRSTIRALQALFFATIFGNQLHLMRPRLIVLTATMPTSYLLILSHLLTINSFSGDLLVHGTQNNFRQCEIEMRNFICSNKGQYVLKGSTFVSAFLQDNPSLISVVFCNSCKQSQHFQDHLEQKLNKMKLNVNVLHINGLLHKTDKFWII
jgi:hypothetical protein